jgi:hypothetical protein
MANYKSSSESGIEYHSDSDTGTRTHSDAFHTVIKREVSLEVYVDSAIKELKELLLSKHRDYGPKNISDSPGGPINGLRVRMHDKLARINNLYEYMEDTKGFQPQHESLEDSFKDMANYAIIGLLVLRGKWEV